MKKKDLKSGMIVMTNNGFYYLVLIDTGMSVSDICLLYTSDAADD